MTLFLCNFASAHHYIVFKSNNEHVIEAQTFTFKSSGLTKELHSFRNYSHYCLKSKGMLMQVKEAPDTYGLCVPLWLFFHHNISNHEFFYFSCNLSYYLQEPVHWCCKDNGKCSTITDSWKCFSFVFCYIIRFDFIVIFHLTSLHCYTVNIYCCRSTEADT